VAGGLASGRPSCNHVQRIGAQAPQSRGSAGKSRPRATGDQTGDQRREAQTYLRESHASPAGQSLVETQPTHLPERRSHVGLAPEHWAFVAHSAQRPMAVSQVLPTVEVAHSALDAHSTQSFDVALQVKPGR
jgi:hypothetical protein